MKLPAVVSLCLLPGAITFAAAPDSLLGFIYYETGNYIAPQPRPRQEKFAATFASDNTYTAAFFLNSPGAGVPPRLGAPGSGTFTYRKIDDTTAEFSLSGVQTGTLRFDSPSALTGTFVDPQRNPNLITGVVQRRFRLAPLSPASGLVNCSNRSFVRPGGTIQTGFVVSGDAWRFVLIRAIGPGLAGFRVTNPLRDPILRVQRGELTNDDWGAENQTGIDRTSNLVGAFPLAVQSKDAALIVELPPLPHVVDVSSIDPGDSGEVLIEIYILP